MEIAILGAGAWGSALAIALSARHRVRLWARDAAQCRAMREERASPRLPGVRIPDGVAIESEFARAVDGCELAIVATSVEGLRPVLRSLGEVAPSTPLLWACKGFESASSRLPHEVVCEVLPGGGSRGALSGPSFAIEVARGLPAALVVASEDAAFAAATIASLTTNRLRLYSSSDVIGVEIGGAVKNVVAIAAGICDGLALGRNARAALVTRGLAEIVRLGAAMGGRRETFMGLAGLGDLILTCTDALSRNYRVGLGLAAGEPVGAIVARLGHVAEGVPSAPAVLLAAERLGVEMPVIRSVCEMLEQRLPATEAVERLLARDPKPEL